VSFHHFRRARLQNSRIAEPGSPCGKMKSPVRPWASTNESKMTAFASVPPGPVWWGHLRRQNNLRQPCQFHLPGISHDPVHGGFRRMGSILGVALGAFLSSCFPIPAGFSDYRMLLFGISCAHDGLPPRDDQRQYAGPTNITEKKQILWNPCWT